MSEQIEVVARFGDGNTALVRGTRVGRYLAGEVDEPVDVMGTRGPGAGAFGFDRFYLVHIPSSVIVCTNQSREALMRVADALSAHGPDIDSEERAVVMDAIMATRIPRWADSLSELPYHHWLREQS
jgi:hypothetical protein